MIPKIEISADFWTEFTAQNWLRQPAVFQLPQALIPAEEVFAGMLNLPQAETPEGQRFPLRFFRGDKQLPVEQSPRPEPADGSLEAFCGRMVDTFRDEGFGLMINNFQGLEGRVWMRALSFLDGLYRRVGMPANGASLDLFLGNYRKTAFGVHKDDQEVFTFVISGRKRFLLWPFEALADRFGVSEEDAWKPYNLWRVDHEELREEAVVLEAGPGEVIYWPATYWHIAENIDGEPVATLGLGLMPSGARLDYFLDAFNETAAAAPGRTIPYHARVGAEGSLEGWWRLLDRAATNPEVRRCAEENWLRWLTRFGFREAPDVLRRRELPETVWLVGNPANPVIYNRHDEDLICAVNGKIFVIPQNPRLVEMLHFINSGRPFQVGDLMRRFSGETHDGDVTHELAREDIQMLLLGLVNYLALWEITV
ncbi:MAG: cupin-like domain-containing protein [Acidobacteriota bacterium]|nr:cupin-like domain-containing protein [Acidobacteriota bacterium]